MKFTKAKGCYDIAPQADEPYRRIEYWYWLEKKLIALAQRFGFEEMRLASFESSELFIRSSGLSSDIVNKEMYTFNDKANRSLTLRPEWTAPIIRAFIENGLHTTTSQKLFYLGPCWRYNRQQKGRYREFRQFGIEIFGNNDPLVDVEILALADSILKDLNLKQTNICINSLGDKSSRDAYKRALIDFLEPQKKHLSKDSQVRLEANPLRILDSKDATDIEICKKAPNIFHFLTKQAHHHFDLVQQGLSDLEVPYILDPLLIRGLDYYCDTVFEINKANDQGRANSLGGGGRFNSLMKELSGPDLAGIGFGLGLERIIQTLTEEQNFSLQKQSVSTLVVPLQDSCKMKSLKIVMQLRNAQISSQLYYNCPNIKKVLHFANKQDIDFVLILGPDEIKKNCILFKEMKKQTQTTISLDNLTKTIKIALSG